MSEAHTAENDALARDHKRGCDVWAGLSCNCPGTRAIPPDECRCGWGGVHDPDNPRCPANGAVIPPGSGES